MNEKWKVNEWVFSNDGTKEIKWVKNVSRRNEKQNFILKLM